MKNIRYLQLALLIPSLWCGACYSADSFSCPATSTSFRGQAECMALCPVPCVSARQTAEKAGMQVIENWATPAGFDTTAKALLSGTPMVTLDGAKAGVAQVSCPGAKNFLEILIQPSGANDINVLQVVLDTDMDGVFDGGMPAFFSAAEPVSGACVNGVISCDPATFKNCDYYSWEYDPAAKTVRAVATMATNLKGCFCFNSSCSVANFLEAKDVILQTIGTGIVDAITRADTGIAAGKGAIDGPVIRYYGDKLADCSVARDGEVHGVPIDLNTFGATDPAAAIKAGITLEQLAQDEVNAQADDPGSLLSLLMNSPAMTHAAVRECVIARIPWLKNTLVDRYRCPTTEIMFASEKACQDAGCYGDFAVDHMFLASPLAEFKNVYTFFSGPAGLDAMIIASKLLGEGGGCSADPRPRLNTFLVEPRTTIEFQAGSCSTNIASMHTGMHPSSGILSPYWQIWPFDDLSSGESATVEVAQVEFGPDGTRLLVTARVVDFQASYDYWCPESDGTVCTDTVVISDHDFITMEFVARDRADFICEYEQQEVHELVEEMQDGCKVLEVDPDCEIRNETRYDAYNTPIQTMINGAFTGAAPAETCRRIGGEELLCHDWWVIERDYFCYDANAAITPDLDRVAVIDRSLAATNSGYGYTDETREVTYDATTEQFLFGNAITGESVFDFSHETAEDCQLSCKLFVSNNLSQAHSAGNTKEYRVDPSSGVVIYRYCRDGVCPANPGEMILSPCACLNEFNRATSIMGILQMTGKDLICSDGVKKVR